MTQYQQPSFSVNMPSSSQYRSNWEATFGKPPVDQDSFTDEMKKIVADLKEIYDPVVETEADRDWNWSTDFVERVYKENEDEDDLISELTYKLADARYENSIRSQVMTFHEAFGLPVRWEPAQPADEDVRLRLRLITEEYLELLESTGKVNPVIQEELYRFCDSFDSTTAPYDRVDLVEFADACADLDFVIEGARQVFGIEGDPIAKEVLRSNMSKLDDDGKPVLREDGKIVKGPNFSPPDVAGELRKQGWIG